MNIYRYTFASECPRNGELIIYKLEIATPRKIYVEHIKTACALHDSDYQESIAADLHARFGGELNLKALHHGVEIETILAEPEGFAPHDSE